MRWMSATGALASHPQVVVVVEHVTVASAGSGTALAGERTVPIVSTLGAVPVIYEGSGGMGTLAAVVMTWDRVQSVPLLPRKKRRRLRNPSLLHNSSGLTT